MSLQPFTINERELQGEDHPSQKTYWSMASSHLELYHYSSNNSNGGHFAEWTYFKHNGCTQSAAMARGVREHKWGLVYIFQYLVWYYSILQLAQLINVPTAQFLFQLHSPTNVSLTLAQSLFSTPFLTPKSFSVWRACSSVRCSIRKTRSSTNVSGGVFLRMVTGRPERHNPLPNSAGCL